MKDIKFRCWDKRTKKMRQLVNIVFNAGFGVDPNDNTIKLIWVKGKNIIEDKDIQIQREDNFELMQYTGIKDKNGKEIYEGDIVKLTNGGEIRIAKVIYEYSGFTIDITNMDKPYGRVSFCMPEKYIEVIGNIYENPELLEDK